MQDDGKGNPTHEPNPLEIKIEKIEPSTIRLEMDTSVVAKLLQAGEKLNYVLIGITQNGMWHKQVG